MEKLTTAILGGIIALILKEIVGSIKESNRLKRNRFALINFIEESIIKSLKGLLQQYKELNINIVRYNALPPFNDIQYPWLNSKILDYFKREDLIKILSKNKQPTIAHLHTQLVNLDYLQENTPGKIHTEFNSFLTNYFKENNLISDQEKELEYINENNDIHTEKSIVLNNIKKRIKQCEVLIHNFEEIIQKLEQKELSKYYYMDLYHTSIKKYEVGETIKSSDFQITEYHKKAIIENKDWIDNYLDQARPLQAPSRKKAVFAFDSIYNCIAFNKGNNQFNYYKVRMINPNACPMCLTEVLNQEVGEENEKNIRIRQEYWYPTKEWRFKEYLSNEMEIIEILETPSSFLGGKGMQNYIEDKELAKEM